MSQSISVSWSVNVEEKDTRFDVTLVFTRGEGGARTFTISKNRDGPSCGDDLDMSTTEGAGTWAVVDGVVTLVASGPFATRYMDSTFSGGNPGTVEAAGELPAAFKVADIAAGGAGVPIQCYEQLARLTFDASAGDVVSFFG